MKNFIIALSFDVEIVLQSVDEAWFLPHMEKLLDLLSKYQAHATFFVVGDIVERYPDLLRRLRNDGHAIGVHAAQDHTELNALTPQAFEEQVRGVAQGIQRITGMKPLGYRAARFSLTDKTAWALPILSRLGFHYDSSIVPVDLGEYGVSGAPLSPYLVSFSSLETTDAHSPLMEVPIGAVQAGPFRVPMGGGVVFRLLPGFLFRVLLKRAAKRRVPVLYFHPHDFYEGGGWKALAHLDPPGILRRTVYRFLRSVGLRSSFLKLEAILRHYKGESIEDMLGLSHDVSAA